MYNNWLKGLINTKLHSCWQIRGWDTPRDIIIALSRVSSDSCYHSATLFIHYSELDYNQWFNKHWDSELMTWDIIKKLMIMMSLQQHLNTNSHRL